MHRQDRCMSRRLLTLITFALVACTGKPVPSPTPVTPVSLEDALQIAIQAAHLGAPEIRALAVDDQSAHAVLTTLAQAGEEFAGQDTLPGVSRPDSLVWAVTLTGEWQDAFPRPTAAATPGVQSRFFIIIDANTGEPYLLGTKDEDAIAFTAAQQLDGADPASCGAGSPRSILELAGRLISRPLGCVQVSLPIGPGIEIEDA